MVRKRKEYQPEEIAVIKFCSTGAGIGLRQRQDGETDEVEVPFSMVGDKALVQRRSKRKGRYPSKLLEIIEPAPQRIPAKCIHFSSCGGCAWQHIPYDMQLQIKEMQIRKLFESHGKEVLYHPALPCETPWYYRNKMEFSFSQNKTGKKFLGLLLEGGRGKVFNMEECHLTGSWHAHTLEALRQWWESTGLAAYHHSKDEGSLRTLTLREGMRTGDRMVILLVSGNPDYALKQSQVSSFVETVKKVAEPQKGRLSIFLRIQQIAKGRPTHFYEMHLAGPDHIREELHIERKAGAGVTTFDFTISPTAFFQPNTFQAERLYSRAIQMAALNEQDTVFDLYCGTGALGVLMAPSSGKVFAVELCKEAVLDAKSNMQNNHITNMEVVAGDVGTVLSEMKEKGVLVSPKLLLLDPPRVGLDDLAMQQVLGLSPKTILYISCNPRTQAANIARLCSEGGYRLKEIQPVDQFAHTAHMENIALLKKIE